MENITNKNFSDKFLQDYYLIYFFDQNTAFVI